VRLRILPGHEDRWDRVLVSLDDITARVAAYRERTEAERYARGLFNHSPVSLWVEDFSAVKKLLDEIRQRGITDFATFIKVHPEFVTRCMQEIRVIDVNRETLRMFGAADTADLLRNIPRVFRDEMQDSFADQLQDLWNHKTSQQREVVNYSLAGDPIHIHMQFTVLLPATDERGVAGMRDRIVSLLDLNNQFHAGQSGHVVHLAVGVATCASGDQLEAALQRADRAMYEDKARHYAGTVA
jgi:PAS domain-containing protein